MNIIIDGKTIEAKEGQSLLNAALDAGVYIPHLCSHPDLEAKGGCRLCSVEIEGIPEAVPACKTNCWDGMVVTINGPKSEKVRRTAMELILATHPADCTGCPKYGKCELQSMYQYLGVSPERWRKKSNAVKDDFSNPIISHLFTRCVRCGRCIRACQELRGVKVLDYIKTPTGMRAGVPEGKSLAEAGCRFCGACVEVCPTGSIVDAVAVLKEERTYADNVVPCRTGCPARIDIPRYIRYIKNGEFGKATAVIREKVPFPNALGLICTHNCEVECKRNHLGKPISICRLKRAASEADDAAWKANAVIKPSTGKKVAVIGGGPGGLTCAYYLQKQGHQVTVFEKNAKAGGQCRYGIPSYRLPDEVMDKEIADILETGVELKCSSPAYSPDELKAAGYDAVVIAVGTHQGTLLPLKGNDQPEVYLNAAFLKSVREGNPMPLGEKVMVLGGGSVAYDCAREAIRLGSKEVHIACLEAPAVMTASIDEIEEGAEEGVILHASHDFKEITGNGKVEGVRIQEISKFYFDENRNPVKEYVEGTEQVIAVDNVIFAVGQKPEDTNKMGVELTHGPYIAADATGKTSADAVFALGDCVTGTKSVIQAIAGGRDVASSVDKFLGGDGDLTEELVPYEAGDPYIGRIEGFAALDRVIADYQDVETRKNNFEEVEHCFTCEQAKCEASRCLQCDLRLNITRPKLWNEY
ncbi:MAG: FAD-dependent oxidoreductase [Parasporobacterium sp.]|nr:FAD-dependent oxidoreductase [Parasporobacterium sp.]